MTDSDRSDSRADTTVTVEARDVDGVAEALGIEATKTPEVEALERFPDLATVVSTLGDIYGGVEEATRTDSRGRSRKMVRQFADREDLDSTAVGHLLRVLEVHGLVEQDGNRWRLASTDSE